MTIIKMMPRTGKGAKLMSQQLSVLCVSARKLSSVTQARPHTAGSQVIVTATRDIHLQKNFESSFLSNPSASRMTIYPHILLNNTSSSYAGKTKACLESSGAHLLKPTLCILLLKRGYCYKHWMDNEKDTIEIKKPWEQPGAWEQASKKHAENIVNFKQNYEDSKKEKLSSTNYILFALSLGVLLLVGVMWYGNRTYDSSMDAVSKPDKKKTKEVQKEENLKTENKIIEVQKEEENPKTEKKIVEDKK